MDRTEEREHMSYDSLKYMRKTSPTWRLMASTNGPFAMSFLYNQFVYKNNRAKSEAVLIAELDYYLETIEDEFESGKEAKDYLRDWADDNYGWLRRFYSREDDEVMYDLTSSAQKAIKWLGELRERSFIGTESRLIMVFDLLNQLVEKTEMDPSVRIAELERQKQELEAEIEMVQNGQMKTLGATQIKERFIQASTMSREILADFRAVEQKFRDLNRDTRKKIAAWDKSKGELIGDYFENQSDIYSSDQGKSFNAFFEFLMSSSAQDEFEQIIEKLQQLDVLKSEMDRSGIDSISDKWLEGSNHVWRTVEQMSEQLRRYIDENYLEEERRINQVIKSIETNALNAVDEIPKSFCMELDETYPRINLLFDRMMFKPPFKLEMIDEEIEVGEAVANSDALYSQVFIDTNKLKRNIEGLIESEASKSVALSKVVEEYPITNGLAEYLAYLSLSKLGLNINYDNTIVDSISWEDQNGDQVVAKAKRTIFSLESKVK